MLKDDIKCVLLLIRLRLRLSLTLHDWPPSQRKTVSNLWKADVIEVISNFHIEARAIRSKIAEGEEWKVLAFTSWTGHRWSKKKNKNHETVLSRFFPEQKTKRSFLLRHLCPVSLSLRTIDLRRRYTDTSFSYKGAFGQEKIQINVFLTRTLLFKNPRTIQSLLAKDIRVWK